MRFDMDAASLSVVKWEKGNCDRRRKENQPKVPTTTPYTGLWLK